MNDFKNNNCRLCKKVFCCKNCREKHENKRHNVFPGCEICIYGTTTFNGLPTQTVMIHITTDHWPLHCLFCKRLFASIEELFLHTKCPLANNSAKVNQKSPYTPHRTNSEKSYSPSYISEKIEYGNKKLSLVCNLVTSTPMQRDQGHFLEKIQEVIITPIDSLSAIKDNNSGFSSTNLKRKVTFCETPITESCSKKTKNKSSVTGETYISTEFLTPSAILERSIYYTATDNVVEKNMDIEKILTNIDCNKLKEENNSTQQTRETSLIIHKEQETLWINAVNVTATELFNNVDEKSLDIHIPNSQFYTPMVPKKKINIVAPSPIIKKEEQISIKFEGPVQISSTPNNSVIPVKSAPNIRDIFRSNRPCTSKSDVEHWGSVDINSEDQLGLSENFKHDTNSNNTENSISNKLWTSVTKLVKNVLHGFSNSLTDEHDSTRGSLKRYYSDQDLQEAPSAKRFKVTDVQCRRTIREMTPINTYMQSYRHARSRELRIRIANKTFVDKSTQTDDDLFIN